MKLIANRAIRELGEFQYSILPLEADNLVNESVYAIKNGQPIGDILQFLQNNLEIKSFEVLQQFVKELNYFYNNTRQWIIKGYTPSEVLDMEQPFLRPLLTNKKGKVINIKKKIKIGRNDPCPCGSGKKYKKCCGKNK